MAAFTTYFSITFYTVRKDLTVASMGTPSNTHVQDHNTTVNN